MLQKIVRRCRLFSVFGMLATATAGVAMAADFQTYQAADVVLGQSDFTTSGSVNGLANRLGAATGVAMDPTTGKVFVSDYSDNRVLRFSSAAAAMNGANPEAVFGQPNFSASSANQGGAGPTASTFASPEQLFVDSHGRLWVADHDNSRVLEFEVASFLGNDPPADRVLGQANFTTVVATTSSTLMDGPTCAVVGPDDTLWVMDAGNSRLLRFDSITNKASTGAAADGVLGQANFTATGPGGGAAGMNQPGGIWADTDGRVWVADYSNNRVLRFDHAASKLNGANADGVLGQPSFSAIAPGTSASTLNSPFAVYLDAAGNLWVSDFNNHRIVRFPAAANQPAGASAADLVLGEPDLDSAGSGATARDISSSYQVSPGPNGSLFVADTSNSRVLRFSPIASATPAPTVTLPGKHALAASKPTFSLRGTASDQNGTLARVEVKVGSAAYKAAKGTSTWKFTAKLKVGKNILLLRAVDVSGASSAPMKVTITRR